MDQEQIQTEAAEVQETHFRRQPQQIRGQQRVAAILDAAEQLFAEIGYQATSTNAIAQRANTSIGSLYQFFPNKKAILQAVVARYHQQYRDLIQNILTDDFFFQSLSDAFDSLISALITLHASHGGIRAFLIGASASSEFATEAQQIHQELFARLDDLLAARVPQLPNAERALTLRILYTTTQTLLELSETVPSHEQSTVLSALKTMLISYLSPIFSPESI
ncbi:TetR/AcrR family transcriptional regulator [Dictyobacter aurantiacus]|uniref:TetR family transcriptional regulator n=1 Tax=Dictyobacter aurantiacus TaxID=1936993 RepID=A0A401ZMA0_9CHLR|nr:TetR/AcrR family transcriptional regulator [Dictyobacter aurantiacus]GCE07962.1 TetR family transcriptional regulator [Dictyobacter aurantiacus]